MSEREPLVLLGQNEKLVLLSELMTYLGAVGPFGKGLSLP